MTLLYLSMCIEQNINIYITFCYFYLCNEQNIFYKLITLREGQISLLRHLVHTISLIQSETSKKLKDYWITQSKFEVSASCFTENMSVKIMTTCESGEYAGRLLLKLATQERALHLYRGYSRRSS